MSNKKLIKTINQRMAEDGGPEEAIELNLSGLELSSISKDVRKIIEKAKEIEVLVISENQLTSLDGLPDWKLSSLVASNNKLTDSSIASIAKFDDLSELLIDGNDIKTLQGLAPLFALKNLIKIDLLDNPVAELSNYRETLFSKLPTLEVLDGLDREGNEVEQELEDDEGEDEDGEEYDEGSEEDDEDEDDQEEDSEPKQKKK